MRSGRCLRELPAHSDPVSSMDFTFDGTVLASCSFDGLVRLWETHNGHCLKTLAIDSGASPLSHVCFSPNGERGMRKGGVGRQLKGDCCA